MVDPGAEGTTETLLRGTKTPLVYLTRRWDAWSQPTWLITAAQACAAVVHIELTPGVWHTRCPSRHQVAVQAPACAAGAGRRARDQRWTERPDSPAVYT